MSILSAIKETNANDGYLLEPIPPRDEYPAPPDAGYRRLSRILRRYDAFILPDGKTDVIVKRILSHNTLAYTTFIDCNRRRTYVQVVKGLEEGKQQ